MRLGNGNVKCHMSHGSSDLVLSTTEILYRLAVIQIVYNLLNLLMVISSSALMSIALELTLFGNDEWVWSLLNLIFWSRTLVLFKSTPLLLQVLWDYDEPAPYVLQQHIWLALPSHSFKLWGWTLRIWNVTQVLAYLNLSHVMDNSISRPVYSSHIDMAVLSMVFDSQCLHYCSFRTVHDLKRL